MIDLKISRHHFNRLNAEKKTSRATQSHLHLPALEAIKLCSVILLTANIRTSYVCAAGKEVTTKAICAVMNTLRALVKIRPEKKKCDQSCTEFEPLTPVIPMPWFCWVVMISLDCCPLNLNE